MKTARIGHDGVLARRECAILFIGDRLFAIVPCPPLLAEQLLQFLYFLARHEFFERLVLSSRG